MDSFWENIFRHREEKEEGIYNILKKIPLFQGLRKKELSAIERILHRRDYRSGEIIFHQGEPAAAMYIIEQGKVKVFYEPTQQVLAELHDGDFFGELALLDDSPRSATVIAKLDCKMLGFSKADLLELIESKPRLGVKIVFHLAVVIGERLKRSNEQVQALQKKLYSLRQQRKRAQENT